MIFLSSILLKLFFVFKCIFIFISKIIIMMLLVIFLGVDLFRKREGVDLFLLIYCDECIIYNFYFNEINKILNYY